MPNQSQTAAEWLKRNPIFLDTETTGLDPQAEVCDLAVVDTDGQVLLNTLIRTARPIPPDAYAIHGISDADVVNAPTFAQVVDQLRGLLRQRLVVVYNAAFDRQMLIQSHKTAKTPPKYLQEADFVCAMELYAAHYGLWNNYYHSYRWQTLDKAAQQCGLAWEGTAHRALADAEMCRRVVIWMAQAGSDSRQATFSF
jgi:DNA polymerase III epsilon subunit-like protein